MSPSRIKRTILIVVLSLISVLFTTKGYGQSIPTATIVNPKDQSEFQSNSTIELQGRGFVIVNNTITEVITGTGLQWQSDKEGNIGTGSSVEVMLSNGAHIITLMVTDSLGNFASTSITIYIHSIQ